MGRNIVICCDGTTNDIVGNSTNVLRLYRSLIADQSQLIYYDAGPGTLSDPVAMTRFERWLRRKLDSAIGHSLRANFCSAYEFLSMNYHPGDQIYLFGFSRGAYAVRAVAGAIHQLGLIRAEHRHLIPHVWALYANDNEVTDQQRFEAFHRYQKLFCANDIPIHFVGVWDTVSSLGWIWDYRTLPSTAHNASIAHVRHAVSLGERRVCFKQNVYLYEGQPAPNGSDIQEIWFPGSHSDVGGGYPDKEDGLAKVTLRWIASEAVSCGLRINETEFAVQLGADGKHSKPDSASPPHESLTGWWWLLEFLPRRTWSKNGMRWHLPNLGRRRTVPSWAKLYTLQSNG